MDKIDYKQVASKLLCYVAFGILGYIFIRYALGYIMPFLIAWGIAYLIFPLANELSSRVKISRKLCSLFLLLILLTIIAASLFLIGDRLLYEIQNFLSSISANSDEIAAFIQKSVENIKTIGEKLPIINKLQNTELIEGITENVNAFITTLWQSLFETLGTAIPNLAASIVTILPNALFVALITVIACFYFAIDIDVLHSKLKSALKPKTLDYVRKLKKRMENGFKKYIKAYLILFAITSAELFVGFLVLGVDYAFALAVLIAIVDFLPVFGTGAILVPWGIIALLIKNYYIGIGILLLFVIITVIRQVIEPKIVGKSLGVHPLLTLVTIYLGFKLFGFFGMVFLPIAVLIFFSKDEEENEKIIMN